MSQAAIYARYSSDLQRDASIEDQVRQCRARIEAEGWTLAGVYSDHATSGASNLRPGYQKLLEDARSGAFDVVLAEALDRLSRDLEATASLYKQLTFAGVRLVTLSEGEVSDLHVGLKGTMNQMYLKDLAQKTRRGLEGRVRQGRSGGGLCYGYDVLKQLDGNGEPMRGGRAINPVESATVRRIFADFAAGSSPRAIAHRLNQEGVPGPRGRAWSDTTIRGHHTRRTGILHNDLYRGRLIWNKQRYVKDPTTAKRLARPNPPETWIIEEVPDLRIIDDALWQQVEDRLAAIRQSPMVEKSRAHRYWEKRRPVHLLTGLVHCGDCGGRYAAVGRDYLACSAARRQGTCGNRTSIRRRDVEALILDALRANLMHPDAVAAFVAEYHAELNRLAAEDGFGRERDTRELEKTARQLDGLIEAIADGLRAPGLQRKLDDLEARKTELERLLAAPVPTPVRFHPNLPQLYAERIAELHTALADPATRTEAITIMREMIDQVVMHPIENGFEIELVGDLAQMVAVAQARDGKNAASVGKASRSVKVVAGARNQLYLLVFARDLPLVRAR
ncbi:MAG: recombinase family protein [Devosia marina]|uniref:recombinase family protein n=1 Tax=Devosia marina TaxID=2683198 RepID=UPI0032EC16F4